MPGTARAAAAPRLPPPPRRRPPRAAAWLQWRAAALEAAPPPPLPPPQGGASGASPGATATSPQRWGPGCPLGRRRRQQRRLGGRAQLLRRADQRAGNVVQGGQGLCVALRRAARAAPRAALALGRLARAARRRRRRRGGHGRAAGSLACQGRREIAPKLRVIVLLLARAVLLTRSTLVCLCGQRHSQRSACSGTGAGPGTGPAAGPRRRRLAPAATACHAAAAAAAAAGEPPPEVRRCWLRAPPARLRDLATPTVLTPKAAGHGRGCTCQQAGGVAAAGFSRSSPLPLQPTFCQLAPQPGIIEALRGCTVHPLECLSQVPLPMLLRNTGGGSGGGAG